ncbi:alkylmercury lyase family protein [Haladaptatus sp. DFWS20]|uniref:alkylmercury lyase family protein n=1 Tax=Haladaptatus sp. DFWS20 TaxID=3403467 RepID=UPI003EB8798E
MTTEPYSRVHYAIMQGIVNDGYAPDVSEIATRLDISEQEAIAGLHDLEERHGVVLHPHCDHPWVIHPFSLAPTLFWVTVDRDDIAGEYWGNCAWCSLGIAELLGDDATVTISTRLGGHDEDVEIQVKDGNLVDDEFVVHFAVPIEEAWDNVHYTCDTILIFESEPDVDDWCEQHAIEKGAVVPLEQVWTLAKQWYGQHLDEEWEKWTAAEAHEIFERVGLTDGFWSVPGTDEAF